MHSHDRTYLASLAFADPDKKVPAHDFACQYLAQPDVAASVLDALFGSADRPRKGLRSKMEVPISKGYGQYKTTIGFLDLVIGYNFAVEVKILPIGVGDLLRQVNLYREYVPDHSWIVVTAYDISPADKAALMAEGVRHLRLGPAFDDWCREQERLRAEAPADSMTYI
jgi:hypothetical protein